MEVMLMTSVMNFEEVFASPVLLAIIESPWNDTYLEIQPPGTEKNSFNKKKKKNLKWLEKRKQRRLGMRSRKFFNVLTSGGRVVFSVPLRKMKCRLEGQEHP